VFLFSVSGSGLSYRDMAGFECEWPFLVPAKSQVDVQDVPSRIDVAMQVLWSLFLVCVSALPTLLDTPHAHALLFSSIFVDLGGADRLEWLTATEALLARVCLMHHRHSSPVDQRKPLP